MKSAKPTQEEHARSYPAHWKGQLVLACRKCQKKLKRSDDLKPLENLKKLVRKSRQEAHADLHVINVPCMDLCPKDAVSVCVPSINEAQIFIVRTENDLSQLALRAQSHAAERD